jgi:branched-chain amino acid aminotransferase
MPLGSKVWLNGRVLDQGAAHLDVADRGFTLGDGLFETLLWTGHEIRFVDDHLARLTQSAAALGLDMPFDVAALKAGLLALTADGGGQTAALRLTLTAGSGPRGLARQAMAIPTCLITIAPYAVPPGPVRLKSVSIRRNCGAPSARFKTVSYLENIMALEEAKALGGDDALLFGTSGYVACTASANIIIRLDEGALTPKQDDGALVGIVRGRLLARGLVTEAHVDPAMLGAASACAVTNALIGVRPVSEIDDRQLEVNEAWMRDLRNALGNA